MSKNNTNSNKLNPWYKSVSSVRGPLIVVDKTKNVSYGEICKIKTSDNREIFGQVLDCAHDKVIVQVFESSMGLDLAAKVQFTSKPAQIGVTEDMLGQVFDGLGRSKGKKIIAKKHLDVNGSAINPAARRRPNNFIQTGISTIDCMTTLVRGQKLPIFSSSGLPHNEVAAQIVRQASVGDDEFVVIFAGMGITNDQAAFFLEDFKKTGAMKRTIAFLNLASDPSVERIITPRVALTTAEYFAYELNKHVLVILTDFTNYCESLREISSARSEVPGRRGYPGYMYTDLAMNYERAGMVDGSSGSITQVPILTMPSGDKTHPVPDLTGYITEGQVVLDQDLHRKGIYPPINPLPSLSRLMGLGVGDGKTREDHKSVADQLYAAYAQGLELRELVSVVGESSLNKIDRLYLKFANDFEDKFIRQDHYEQRSIEETLNLSWKLFSVFPKAELKKIKRDLVDKYLKKD